MTSLTRIDRLVAQLRTQLARQGKRAGGSEGATVHQGHRDVVTVAQDPVALVRALHAAGVKDERTLIAHMVESMLKRELGDEMSNDSQFQQMLGVMVETLADSPEAWSLCRKCVRLATG